jgi:hypothetical protein
VIHSTIDDFTRKFYDKNNFAISLSSPLIGGLFNVNIKKEEKVHKQEKQQSKKRKKFEIKKKNIQNM